MGHSLGGVAAQVFAIRYPEIAKERLRGMVLLSTIAHTPFGSRSTQTKAQLERIFNRVPDTTRVWAAPNLGLLLARIGFGKDPRPSHVELVRQMMVDCSAQTRLEAPRVLVGLDLVEDLEKIEVPTLVISGTADVLAPPAEGRRLARHIPNARFELIEGAGHMIMLERIELFDRLVIDFARQVGLHPHPECRCVTRPPNGWAGNAPGFGGACLHPYAVCGGPIARRVRPGDTGPWDWRGTSCEPKVSAAFAGGPAR